MEGFVESYGSCDCLFNVTEIQEHGGWQGGSASAADEDSQIIAGDCLQDCHSQFLGSISPGWNTSLAPVCQALTSAPATSLWPLYWCDATFCGVGINDTGGLQQDPNVDSIINDCQDIGYHSVLDPGPPPADFTCETGPNQTNGEPGSCTVEQVPQQTLPVIATNHATSTTMTVGQPSLPATPTSISLTILATELLTAASTATPTATPGSAPAILNNPSGKQSANSGNINTLSGGAKLAVITVCSALGLVVLVCTALVLLRCWRRRKSKTSYSLPYSDSPSSYPHPSPLSGEADFIAESRTHADVPPLMPPLRLRDRKFLIPSILRSSRGSTTRSPSPPLTPLTPIPMHYSSATAAAATAAVANGSSGSFDLPLPSPLLLSPQGATASSRAVASRSSHNSDGRSTAGNRHHARNPKLYGHNESDEAILPWSPPPAALIAAGLGGGGGSSSSIIGTANAEGAVMAFPRNASSSFGNSVMHSSAFPTVPIGTATTTTEVVGASSALLASEHAARTLPLTPLPPPPPPPPPPRRSHAVGAASGAPRAGIPDLLTPSPMPRTWSAARDDNILPTPPLTPPASLQPQSQLQPQERLVGGVALPGMGSGPVLRPRPSPLMLGMFPPPPTPPPPTPPPHPPLRSVRSAVIGPDGYARGHHRRGGGWASADRVITPIATITTTSVSGSGSVGGEQQQLHGLQLERRRRTEYSIVAVSPTSSSSSSSMRTHTHTHRAKGRRGTGSQSISPIASVLKEEDLAILGGTYKPCNS